MRGERRHERGGAAGRRHVVVGTAGHIDHGKSTLVRAMTGIDPDRLQEEKERGITIDLGFAHATHGETRLAFVDVPGHERFVHNMLAGASGIDVLLLVVAADESVMPQTREHLGICSLLGLRAGVVALTCIDRADRLLADVAEQEIRDLVAGTFLERSPIVRVSGATGEGIDALRDALVAAAATLPDGGDGPWMRLPIDRVFAVRGFGTVVTGTLHGGTIAEGQTVLAIPGGARARVRGLQVHGEEIAEARPPCRVAVNLHGADRETVRRGMTLVPEGCDVTTRVLDAALDMLADAPAEIEDGQRVRIHHGTDEVMARVRLPAGGPLAPGARGAAQVRLERPLAVLPGDRFIVRRYSPVTTLAGGRVADIDPPRWRRGDADRADAVLHAAGLPPAARWEHAALSAPRGVTPAGDARRLGLAPESAASLSRVLADGGAAALTLLPGGRLVADAAIEALLGATIRELEAFHARDPLAGGLALGALRARVAEEWDPEPFRALVALGESRGLVEVGSELARLAGHRTEPAGRDKEHLERMLGLLEESGLDTRTTAELADAAGAGGDARALLEWADRAGRARRVGADRWVSAAAFADVVERLVRHAETHGPDIDVPAFKALFGLTRKSAIPLLERLDDEGVTRRAGDRRRIMAARVDGAPGS